MNEVLCSLVFYDLLLYCIYACLQYLRVYFDKLWFQYISLKINNLSLQCHKNSIELELRLYGSIRTLGLEIEIIYLDSYKMQW